jgi:hypothetical protein
MQVSRRNAAESVQPKARLARLQSMAKPNHAKRSRPRPVHVKRRRADRQRAADLRARREVERWRRG